VRGEGEESVWLRVGEGKGEGIKCVVSFCFGRQKFSLKYLKVGEKVSQNITRMLPLAKSSLTERGSRSAPAAACTAPS
jgi:hypothetical protein